MRKTMNGKRCCLYSLACCLVLSLAAGPSSARPVAKHRKGSHAAKHQKRSAVARPPGDTTVGFSNWPHTGLHPNSTNADANSYRVRYVPPHGKDAACVLISMHLDSYDEIQDGNGSFQGQTPLGPVRVVWQRKWQTIEKDEQGRPIGSEFNIFLFYTLTIDSPQTLPIHLETQQYDLYAMRLNDGLIPLGPHLSGEVDIHGPYDARHLSYPFPGGHNVLILRMGVFTSE